MRRGPWHQFGDKSQRLVIEQLQQGAGVGVILSPRDLPMPKAIEFAQRYHGLDASVLIDQQFYVPHFRNPKLDSYPIRQSLTTTTQLLQTTDSDLATLATDLYAINSALSADGLIAPALVYEAGRSDIVQLNARLFSAAKQAGDELGIPTYATVIIGNSAIASNQTINEILSHATSLNSAGFYYSFEFSPERIPSSRDSVLKCCTAGLTLACTGLPVLHAYAGPMALLSLGFGATGAAIGHSQNLWRFPRSRWAPPPGQGGGGKAPPRFFSHSLWGTIIYPDEITRLPQPLRSQVLTHSPFSSRVSSNRPFTAWTQWAARKHMVYIICSEVATIANNSDPLVNANTAIKLLQRAVNLHGSIASTALTLRDNTNAYQENWRLAMTDLINTCSADYSYLALLSSIN
jgi:hypothetical protein